MNNELLNRLWKVYCKGGRNGDIPYTYFKNVYDKDLNFLIHIVSKAYLVNVIGVKNNLLLAQLIYSDDIANHIIAFEMIYKHYLDNK